LYEKGYNASDLSVLVYEGVVRGDVLVPDQQGGQGYYYQQLYHVDTPDHVLCRDADPHSTHFFNDPFPYVSSTETPVDCPGSEEGTLACMQLTNDADESVVINHASRYVMDTEYTYTWYNDVRGKFADVYDLSHFSVTMCNTTKLDPPPRPANCNPQNGVFTPSDYPCVYHLSYPWYDEDFERDNIVHEVGMSKGSTFLYHEIGLDPSNPEQVNFKAMVRGEFPFGEDRTYRYDRNYNATLGEYDCIDDVGQKRYYNGPYAYVSIERDISCPTAPGQLCDKMVNISGDFVIVNKRGDYIFDPYGWNITWYDTFEPIFDHVPTAVDFKTTTCHGVELPLPSELCITPAPSPTPTPTPAPTPVPVTPQQSSAASYAISVVVMVLAAVALLI